MEKERKTIPAKMKIEVTRAQLKAIMNMTDDMSAMLGGADYESDKIWKHNLKLIDRMLKKNGFKRDFL